VTMLLVIRGAGLFPGGRWGLCTAPSKRCTNICREQSANNPSSGVSRTLAQNRGSRAFWSVNSSLVPGKPRNLLIHLQCAISQTRLQLQQYYKSSNVSRLYYLSQVVIFYEFWKIADVLMGCDDYWSGGSDNKSCWWTRLELLQAEKKLFRMGQHPCRVHLVSGGLIRATGSIPL